MELKYWIIASTNWKEKYHISTLSTDEKYAIIDHLNTCDIPVEASTYIQYANNAGFNCIEKVDIDTRHVLLVFSKN